jgi:hypothetical protein
MSKLATKVIGKYPAEFQSITDYIAKILKLSPSEFSIGVAIKGNPADSKRTSKRLRKWKRVMTLVNEGLDYSGCYIEEIKGEPQFWFSGHKDLAEREDNGKIIVISWMIMVDPVPSGH